MELRRVNSVESCLGGCWPKVNMFVAFDAQERIEEVGLAEIVMFPSSVGRQGLSTLTK